MNNKLNFKDSDYISFLEKSNHNLIKQLENNTNFFKKYYDFHKKLIMKKILILST